MILLTALALGSALADTPAALPTLELSWRQNLLFVAVKSPAGEHIAPEGPVTGEVAIGDSPPVHIETFGATLAHGLAVVAPGQDRTLTGTLSLSLCVDGGTTCRPVDVGFEVPLSGRRGTAVAETFIPRKTAVTAEAEAPSIPVEEAFAQAGKEGRLVLLDFGAIWCPPCNLLNAQLLDDPENRADLAGFVLARIDVDHPSSWTVKDRYHVGGYPTLVAARPDGTEIDRLLGYPGEDRTLAWLGSLGATPDLGAPPDPASLDEAAAVAWALRLARAGLTEEAGPYLARVGAPPPPALLDTPDLRLAQTLVNPSAEGVRWLIAHGVDWREWLDRGADLAEEDATLRPVLRVTLRKALGEASAAEGADLLWYAGNLAEQDKSPDAPLLYKAGAALLTASLSGEPRQDRGNWTFLAELHESAGDADAAEAVLNRAVAAYPEEFTFLHALAGLLDRAGRPADALPHALAALAVSYGDNQLRATERAARLLAKLDRKEEALELIDRALAAAPRPPEGLDVRTPRYLSNLEKARAEIAAPPPPAKPAPTRR